MTDLSVAVNNTFSQPTACLVRCFRFTGSFAILLAVTAVACDPGANTAEQVEQCREVVAFWSAPHSDLQHGISQSEQALTVNIRMTIKSALGEQSGSGSCSYSLADNGVLATRPARIVVGKTVLTSDKDISDALSLKKDFDLPAHKH